MKETIRIIAASALLTGLLIKAVPAVAEPAAPQNVTIVHTTDLDLSTGAGLRALDRRLSAAAWAVCGTASDIDLQGKNEARICRQQVVTEGRRQADHLIATRNSGGSILLAAR